MSINTSNNLILKDNKNNYQISINTAEDKKEKDKENSNKRENQKFDKYMQIVTQLLLVNSNISNATHNVNDNFLEGFQEKRKVTFNNKNNHGDGQDQKFSITQLRDKSESLVTHKKGFFVIADDLNEDDDEMSLKLKREILVSKLMSDKNIIIDKNLLSNFYDQIWSNVFLSLSNESRRVLVDQYEESIEDYNLFHKIIGFNHERADKSYLVSNEAIIYLCEKLLKFEDSKNNKITLKIN